MRVGADNGLDMAAAPIRMARRVPQTRDVRSIGRARVNDEIASSRIANEIAIGARPGHETGVGCGQSLQVGKQRHGARALPFAGRRQVACGMVKDL